MDKINIDSLNDNEQQALVCMFFAKLPSTDIRYKKRNECFHLLSRRYGKSVNTYKNDKDTYDYYFSENMRQGWKDVAISRRGAGYQEVFDKYKDYNIDILETAVNEIINNYILSEEKFISMKCSFPNIIHDILKGKKVVTIDGLYTLTENLTDNAIVFFTLGGDMASRKVDWNTGFYAIAHIIKPPYDYGAEGKGAKYFKIDIAIDVKLPRAMSKEAFIKYKNVYDAPFIGPELKRDPTQAISLLSQKQAVAVVRAIIDNYSNLKDDLEKIFGTDFMSQVYEETEILIPVSLKYGETIKNLKIAEQNEQVSDFTKFIKSGENILYYGVPGSGKSFKVEQYLKENITDECLRRVVFHPDYTYSDFVGQIMPVLVYDKDNNNKINYEFVSGPFTDILNTAYQNPSKKCCLVIEEINRGNAPAIFGEIFQLLDRETDNNKSDFRSSKYQINNNNIASIIKGKQYNNSFIKIPPNLSIIATMNTSDQNVFSMDTAFQRRWKMKHIKNIFSKEQAEKFIPKNQVCWGAFAETINEILASRTNGFGSLEDKSLGAYFATEEDFSSIESFSEKVIKYLWDDAFKLDRGRIFIVTLKNLYTVLDIVGSDNGLKDIFLPEVYDLMLQKTSDLTMSSNLNI